MTESLFLMQRYWGSDDSDIDVSENTEKSTKSPKKAKKNKQKSPVSEIDEINKTSGNDNISFSDKSADFEKGKNLTADKTVEQLSEIKVKKKHKKVSKTSEEICDFNERQNEEVPQINGDQINGGFAEESEIRNEILPKLSKKKKQKHKKAIDNKFESDVSLDIKDAQNIAVRTDDSTSVDDEVRSSVTNEVENFKNSEDNKLFPVMRDMITKGHEKIHRILPEWLEKPTIIPIDTDAKERSISELDYLDDTTKQNLQKSGIHSLFPVQAEVIPWLTRSTLSRFILPPSDLCVSAPTGSGKTLAFVIPIIQSLKTRIVTAVRALIVLPVGDLATQVFKVFQAFCKGTDLQVILAIGQKSFTQEQSLLVKKTSRGYLSNADILVCTPGRLIDHIDRTPGFSLQKLQYLVIDEADRMMEEIQHGWIKRVENAVQDSHIRIDCSCFTVETAYQKLSCDTTINACTFGTNSEPPLQKLLFSATLSQDPEKLHELSLYRPKLFMTVKSSLTEAYKTDLHTYSENEVIGQYVTPDTLTEYFITCESSIKPLVICHVLKTQQYKKVLCFTQSIEHAHRLYIVLSNMLDSSVRELSSNLKAIQRKIVLERFESGNVHVLVCSDILARGIDIQDVDCVISYDVPLFIKQYVHRIGRTARAGKSGTAITFLETDELQKFKRMLTKAGKKLPSKLNFQTSDLVPFEESFKKALSLSSDAIAEEKRKNNKMKIKSNLQKRKLNSSLHLNGQRTSKQKKSKNM